jgi:S-formylglutathione hydrolase FrmB
MVTMSLTGGWMLALAVVAAVAAVAETAALWSRIGRAWLRWPLRASMIIACQLTACLVLGLVINDQGQFFTSWSDLLGRASGTSNAGARSGAYDRALAALLPAGRRGKQSLVVPVAVPDAGADRSHTALVYLPPQYFQPAYANRSFPVIELLTGFPGSPETWTGPLDIQGIADSEIASGRAVPFIAVMPNQNYVPGRDSECINALGGSQVETTLTVNVRRVVEHDFRVSDDRTSWGIAGYSTGGFCAANIAVRHPGMFAAAVSMSGNIEPYLDRRTGALFGHSIVARHANDPLWRFEHLPGPDIALLLTSSRQEPRVNAWAYRLAAAARLPTRAELLSVPRGGHNFHVWRVVEHSMFNWLSEHLAAPLAPGLLAEGVKPEPRPGVTPPPAARVASRRALGRPR